MENKRESIFPEEQNSMEELQYNMSVKVMSTCCQFGFNPPVIVVFSGQGSAVTQHADIWLH